MKRRSYGIWLGLVVWMGSSYCGLTLIDAAAAFILHRLRQKGIPPAALADRITLIRQAAYDLAGLPSVVTG